MVVLAWIQPMTFTVRSQSGKTFGHLCDTTISIYRLGFRRLPSHSSAVQNRFLLNFTISEVLHGTSPATCKSVLNFRFFCVAVSPQDHPCQAHFDECATLRCPYGIEAYVDDNQCNRCQCQNPCSKVDCPPNSQCAIDINRNKTSNQDPDFIAVCRESINLEKYHQKY